MTTFNPYARLNAPLPNIGQVSVLDYLDDAQTCEYACRSSLLREGNIPAEESQQLSQLITRTYGYYQIAMQSVSDANAQAAMTEAQTRISDLTQRKFVPIKDPLLYLEYALLQKDPRGAIKYLGALQGKTQEVAYKFLCLSYGTPSQGQMIDDLPDFVYNGTAHFVNDPIKHLLLEANHKGMSLFELLKQTEKQIADDLLATQAPAPTQSTTTSSLHLAQPTTHTRHTKKKSNPANDSVTQELAKFMNSNNSLAFNFLTTTDNSYAEILGLHPKAESIAQEFGDLVFHPNDNREDKTFVEEMKIRKWFPRAQAALENHASVALFSKGKKVVINSACICHYLCDVKWTKEEKNDAYRFLKEVIKHCIIRNARTAPKSSRRDPRPARNDNSSNVSSKSGIEQTPNDLLIPFYTQGAKNSHGKTLEKYLKTYDDDQLEEDDDFIQWLFPLFTESKRGGSKSAKLDPVLNQDLASKLTQSLTFRTNLHQAYCRMLQYYGFVVVAKSNGKNSLERINESEKLWWVTEKNHNFKRISRMLQCLTNMGMADTSREFLKQLKIVKESKEGKKWITDETFEYWSNACKVKAPQPQQQQPQSPPLNSQSVPLPTFPLHQHQHHHHHHHHHHQQLYPSLSPGPRPQPHLQPQPQYQQQQQQKALYSHQ